ncbi:MAG TPA: glycosyltransferase family 9 protein [Gemmatimonadaceae bacterium]|nr:glycosyltransferase family 9 protein [Gemmatimonadaceae bacterium]
MRARDGRPGTAIVRAPNHLGDLVMALPALRAAGNADVMVVRGLTPLLEMADLPGQLVPFDRGTAGFWRAARTLRGAQYERGILLPPSLSSALLFTAGNVRNRRGTPANGRRPLLQEVVPLHSTTGVHRSSAYYLVVTGTAPADAPIPAVAVPEEARERFRTLAGPLHGAVIGLCPGSNAPSRRWDADRYASLARRLVREGARVFVFGGPAEQRLTASVAGEVAVDLGGRTDLALLAAGLASCRVVVTNDSGPMHLAAAVGTPTLSLQGPADPAVTRPLGAGHRMLQHPELPCVPCVKNVCPRSGRGYVLPDATRECLRLISVDDAVTALRANDSAALSLQ